MIGILQDKKLTTDKLREIEEWHWEKISNLTVNSKFKIPGKNFDDLCKYVEDNIKNPEYNSLKKIALAPYGLLAKIKSKVSKNSTFGKEFGKFRLCNSKATHFMAELYKDYRTKYGMELVKKLGLTVCPYCNRNFINNGKDRAMAQFDHFFSKSTYPIFAVSLYNLVPSCTVCNHTKSVFDVTYSPYNSKYTTDNLLTFNHIQSSLNNYEIEINGNTVMQKNIEVLQLEEQYQIHTDLVVELRFKAQKANPELLKSLNGMLPDDRLMSPEELYYGNYFTEENYHKRPLSKFTRDVVQQIKHEKKKK